MSTSTPRTPAELRASIERRAAMYFGSNRDLLALLQPLLSGRPDGPARSIHLSLRADGSVTLTLDTPSFASLDASGRKRLASDDVDIWRPGEWLHVVRAASSAFEIEWRDSVLEARFAPDTGIITDACRPHRLLGYLRDLATAHPGTRANFVDERSATSASLHYPRGARSTRRGARVSKHEPSADPYRGRRRRRAVRRRRCVVLRPRPAGRRARER